MVNLKDLDISDEKKQQIRDCCIILNTQSLKECDYNFKDIGRNGKINVDISS